MLKKNNNNKKKQYNEGTAIENNDTDDKLRMHRMRAINSLQIDFILKKKTAKLEV